MNSRIISLTAMLVLTLSALAIGVETDRTWYLAGEPMTVSVTVEGQRVGDGTSAETDATIAYAELCDTRGLAAGVVVSLKDGVGRGVIELPSDLHSGYYMLSAYTRNDTHVSHRLVAVVNPLHKSADDDITWVESLECRVESVEFATATEHSVEFAIATDGSAPFKAVANTTLYTLNYSLSPESDSHIILARVQNVYDGHTFRAGQISPSLSIVGKQIHYFEGAMVNDTLAVFHTYGLQGKLPLVVSAVSSTGVSLPVELVSPFAAMLPRQLPHLVFHYYRSEVEGRSASMQRHQIALARIAGSDGSTAAANGAATILDSDAQRRPYDPRVFGTTPDLSYNLDEYRQFLTVREVLLEYVSCVTKRKTDGVSQLYVRKEQELYNTSLPTLVLIDGMPVFDVERLLNYDARRVHFINIYGGQYTFGSGIYNGILSFVTRSGLLTNYPVERNMQYLEYTFPE